MVFEFNIQRLQPYTVTTIVNLMMFIYPINTSTPSADEEGTMGDKNKFINTGLPMNDSEEHIRWADSEDVSSVVDTVTMVELSSLIFMLGHSNYVGEVQLWFHDGPILLCWQTCAAAACII